MIAICIKNIDTLFFEYSVGSKYQIRKIYKSKDLIFHTEETNYEIVDNYGEIHTFNQLGFNIYFTTIQKQRRNKLKKLNYDTRGN